MKSLAHLTIGISLAGAVFVGCIGKQPPINALPEAALRDSSSGKYDQLYLPKRPSEGTKPKAALLNVNSTLYGTDSLGGLKHKGVVYSITPAGTYKVLYRFRGGSDGSNPQSGLIDVKGTLYGTTYYGGGSSTCPYGLGCGTVYSISASGTEKVLYAFTAGDDGAYPAAGLTELDGKLYGTTTQGGTNECPSFTSKKYTCGTIFSITTTGVETVLHSFGTVPDGSHPQAALIIVNSVLYGTTLDGGSCSYGGEAGCGTVYSITTSGAEKVLYSFQGGSDGFEPFSGLTRVGDSLYGTTFGDRVNGCSDDCGTIYRVSTAGREKVIYHFAGGSSDGAGPWAGLLDMNGTLYGTTYMGGIGGKGCNWTAGCGTLYRVTTGGVETVLHDFVAGTDGSLPVSPPTALGGTLYGTTPAGGHRDICCHIYGFGTIYTWTP